MVPSNTCISGLNAWVEVLGEVATALGMVAIEQPCQERLRSDFLDNVGPPANVPEMPLAISRHRHNRSDPDCLRR